MSYVLLAVEYLRLDNWISSHWVIIGFTMKFPVLNPQACVIFLDCMHVVTMSYTFEIVYVVKKSYQIRFNQKFRTQSFGILL